MELAGWEKAVQEKKKKEIVVELGAAPNHRSLVPSPESRQMQPTILEPINRQLYGTFPNAWKWLEKYNVSNASNASRASKDTKPGESSKSQSRRHPLPPLLVPSQLYEQAR